MELAASDRQAGKQCWHVQGANDTCFDLHLTWESSDNRTNYIPCTSNSRSPVWRIDSFYIKQ